MTACFSTTDYTVLPKSVPVLANIGIKPSKQNLHILFPCIKWEDCTRNSAQHGMLNTRELEREAFKLAQPCKTLQTTTITLPFSFLKVT